MMQRPPHRIRPASSAAAQRQASAIHAEASKQTAKAPDDGVDRERLVEEFEAALLEERDVTAEQRESILQQYRNALQMTPIELPPSNLDDLRNSFLQMTESMAQAEVIAPSQREDVLRQFNTAIEALDSPEIRRSREFAQRVKTEGREAAVSWLASQTKGSSLPASSPPFAPSLATTAARPRRRR